LALFSATLAKHGRGHAPNATLDDAFTQLAAEVLRHRHDHQRMASAAEDRTRRQALRAAEPRPAAARTWSPRQVPQPATTRS